MFRKLLSRLLGRRPDDRSIFPFHDGTRPRFADPVVLWARLEEACGGDPVAFVRLISQEPPPAPPGVDAAAVHADLFARKDAAARTLADAVCTAFGVEPLSDEGGTVRGLTRQRRIGLAVQLAFFLGGLAEQARPFASTRSLTGTSPPA